MVDLATRQQLFHLVHRDVLHILPPVRVIGVRMVGIFYIPSACASMGDGSFAFLWVGVVGSGVKNQACAFGAFPSLATRS